MTGNETVEITSPNYPDEYDNNENEVWTVTGPPGTAIYFEIQESHVRMVTIKCLGNAN